MTQNTIILIVLAVLVVFSLSALYRKKKSGDLTLWGKGRNILGQLPSEEAACAAVSSSSRNGSQKDILRFVSSLMKLVRKNHWYIVMPGQLSDGKTKTNLSLVLITQHRVMLGSAAPHSVASWRLRANTPPGGAGAVRGRGASAPHVPDAVALRAIGAKIRRATMTDGSFACAGIIGRARFKKR